MEGVALKAELPPTGLYSTKRPAFITKNGSLDLNTSKCL